jgi:hypothetical protein
LASGIAWGRQGLSRRREGERDVRLRE